MAIDTAQKRASLLSLLSPFGFPLIPSPDGTIDARDRGIIVGLATPTIEAVGGGIHMSPRRIRSRRGR